MDDIAEGVVLEAERPSPESTRRKLDWLKLAVWISCFLFGIAVWLGLAWLLFAIAYR